MPNLLKTLHAQLAEAADPIRAPQMQRYMKSEMPYLGVSAVPLRAVTKSTFAKLKYDSSITWQNDVLSIWRSARFREERLCAIELTGIRTVRPFLRIDALPMFEEMIVTGAWWDYVDSIATQRLIHLLRNDPGPMKQKMLAWSRCNNMWKRRSAILCQIKAKKDTDLTLLYRCIEPSLDSKEFFLRKAIGWALRQYAWTDSEEVSRFVEENRTKLSGLTIREATKNIHKSFTIS